MGIKEVNEEMVAHIQEATKSTELEDTQTLDTTYIAHTYGRQPVEFVQGKGATLIDKTGNTYIDMSSGIGVTAFGFCDSQWQAAVIAQVEALNHVSNLYYTSPQAKLAEILCHKTGMKKVFFCNSGAEANECAIKVARKYSHDTYGPNRYRVVTLQNSFHGRTLGTLIATGQEVFHQYYGPFPEGFSYMPPNDIEAIPTYLGDNSVCAVMMESIQGEGGVMPLDDEFVKAVVDYAHEHDILVIMDEVQTGNGRTGKLYGYEYYGITPDIVSTAKGLAGGLPMGATLLGEKVEHVLQVGDHGSTFGGNPICAAGAISIMSRMDEAMLQSVREKGQYIKDRLTGQEGILSVSGKGLMIGIETVVPVKDVLAACLQKGVVLLSAKQKVRLLPALTISYEEIDIAMKALLQSIQELRG